MIVITLAFLHLLAVIAWRWWMEADVAMLVSMGEMLRGGAVPMRDMIDTNPPLIMYLSVVPTWVRDVAGIDIVRATHLSVLALIAASGGVGAWLLARVLPEERRWLPALFLLLLANVTALLLYRGDYGQRDQLIFLMLLPYALHAALRLQGERSPALLQSLIALFLAVALLMKPMYGALPVGVELWLLIRLRWKSYLQLRRLRVPLEAAALVIILFLLLPSLRDYYGNWWPLFVDFHRAMGYDPLGEFGGLLLSWEFLVSVISFVLAVFLARGHARWMQLIQLLGILFAAMAIAMIVQGKGWSYHYVPLHHVAALIVGFAMYLLIWRQVREEKRPRATMLLLVVFLLLQIGFLPRPSFWLHADAPRPAGNAVSSLITQLSDKDDSIVAISDEVDPQFPAITYAGRRYGSRYYYAFPVTMCYAGRNTISPWPDRAWFEEKYYRELMEDIRTHAPAILLIERGASYWNFPPGMTIYTWLQSRGFFEQIAPDYAETAYLSDYNLEIWVRTHSDRRMD
ncbi:hypothetical protein KQI65_00165 [bacterium]|nr:hypothetical protein [bacterium]